jgi:DNA-binding CsgD family transcriptional regulator
MAPTKERYAEALLPLATQMVEAVHDGGPDGLLDIVQQARALPAPDGVDPDIALAVILAAMVDPTQGLERLLGWTRRLAEVRMTVLPGGQAIDEIAVEQAIAGRLAARKLTAAELDEAVRILTRSGASAAEIARRCRCSPRTVHRLRATYRDPAA